MARRGRKLSIEWAAEDDAASLHARYRRERRADVRPRLHALWLVRRGHTTREAAEVLGVDERTVQRWLGWGPGGGLGVPLPIGYVRATSGEVMLDPDEQVQTVVRLVFSKFEELGTLNAVLRWLAAPDPGPRTPGRQPRRSVFGVTSPACGRKGLTRVAPPSRE